MTQYCVQPSQTLSGTHRVPGDKSISHRSIMFGSLADGTTTVQGFLDGDDCLATLNAFRNMGVKIDGPDNGELTIHGVGVNGLRKPAGPLDLGNSGTSMRLLAGLLAGQVFDSELTGDESLSKRPMRRVTSPLAAMGASIQTTTNGTAPLKIKGSRVLRGLDYDQPMASAQVKSCLLLAGLYAKRDTIVKEPGISRDHTERMLRAFGYDVRQLAENTVALTGGGRLTATHIDVPADISSAAFFLVGASIADEAEILLEGVGINPTRTGVLDILKLMGADITQENPRQAGDEPVADLRVRSAPLRGIRIPEHLVPLAIDEFPAIFIAAACAEGETVLTGAAELRVKESDRIQVMADGLAALGVTTEVLEDGIRIQGYTQGDRPAAVFNAGEIHSHGDHRIAMSFAMAALRASGEITIHDCDNVNTSFPGFAALAANAGLNLQ